MANAEPHTTSSFPPPPTQYINKYTDENIRLGRAPKPPPPIKDSYWMFGAEFKVDDHIVRPLESQSLLRLHPHNYDHKRELKKLNFSILVNFLDLLEVLVKAPDSRRRLEKLDDLNLLFIHMHHLINEFRPHQARETLHVMLENQKQQRLEQAEKIEKCNKQVRELLNATVASLPDNSQLESKLLINKNMLFSTSQPDKQSFGVTHVLTLPGTSQVSINTVDQKNPNNIKIETDMEVVASVEIDNDVRDEMMCNIVDALN